MLDARRRRKELCFTQFHHPSVRKLREIIGNDTTARDKPPLKGLGVTKGEYGDVDIMLKTGMKVAQDYSVFNYRHPRPQSNGKSQDIMMAEGTGANLVNIFFFQGILRIKLVGKSPHMHC